MDKDASFCPPILYAPSTDEINGFALSTTKKLVERIEIYFPEKVEKQKSKKTERTKDKSGVVEFAAKMERWRSTGESYKSKLSTRLNELYRKIIENTKLTRTESLYQFIRISNHSMLARHSVTFQNV